MIDGIMWQGGVEVEVSTAFKAETWLESGQVSPFLQLGK